MTFRSDRSFQNAVVEVIGDVATFVTISPSSFASVPAEQDQTVSLSFSVPQGSALGTLNGTVQVRSGGQTLTQSLSIALSVWHRLTSPDLRLSLQHPAELIQRASSDETLVYLARTGEEYPGQGIAISRRAGNVNDVIAQLNVHLVLVDQSIEEINGFRWHLLIHRDPQLELEFFRSVTERNGTTVRIVSRNAAETVIVLKKILQTVKFLD